MQTPNKIGVTTQTSPGNRISLRAALREKSKSMEKGKFISAAELFLFYVVYRFHHNS